MLVIKKNIEEFYNELRNKFPKIKSLSTWENYDWSNNGLDNSTIMTELAEEMTGWILNNEIDETQNLLDFIETSFFEYDNKVTSYICTDFLVTIMEFRNTEKRELIKKMMKNETKIQYKKMLEMYREL